MSHRQSVSEVFNDRDAVATRRLYAELEGYGPAGAIAVNILRASKKSTLAKQYRGRNYHSLSYDGKEWAINQLIKLLVVHAGALGIRWGWKEDPDVVFGQEVSWVLYVDLPFEDVDGRPSHRQVSYHAPTRSPGPDYQGQWDGKRGMSNQHAIDFAERVRAAAAVEP